jgi:hypothetical protein
MFTVLNSVKTADIRLSARSIISDTHIISELELSQINLNLALGSPVSFGKLGWINS